MILKRKDTDLFAGNSALITNFTTFGGLLLATQMQI